MIASLADHGIARTRQGESPAGCFAGSGATRVAAALALAALAGGCSLFAGPVVIVENHSPWRVDSLWAVTSNDSVLVPAMDPGATAKVRPHAQVEDLVVLRGRASGHALAPSLGAYVEASGGYHLRATIGASGAIDVVETRVGGN